MDYRRLFGYSLPLVLGFCLMAMFIIAAKADTAAARRYLVETATPGFTMLLQGPDIAIGRLHPEFAERLADAIAEARANGLPDAGVYSAYRPPIFGVGGFDDKFQSLHAYGLAVDMTGVGSPGSSDARKWHEIAAKHHIVCPYGSSHRVEWNHCQITRLMQVRRGAALRVTIKADAPDLERMWAVGESVLVSADEAIHPLIASSLKRIGKKNRKHKDKGKGKRKRK